jgi:hypothetical protein
VGVSPRGAHLHGQRRRALVSAAAVDILEQLTHRDVHRMMQRLQQDVLAIRRRAGPVPVVLLADGAPELWPLFEQHPSDLDALACSGLTLSAADRSVELR